MKKTVMVFALLTLMLNSFAQTQSIAGAYKISFMLLENNTKLTPANKDSMIEAATFKTINKIIKDGEPVDSADVKNTHTAIINLQLSLTINLKSDGKYSMQTVSVVNEKLETNETGLYTFNAKTKQILFKPKVKKNKTPQPLIIYNSTDKTINIIAGKTEPDAGKTIVQFIKTN